MDVTKLRNYGIAFSDAESSWPAPLEAEMRKKGQAVVLRHLGAWQRVRFVWELLAAKRRAAALDLSDLRARGMTNERFLAQQLEYLALFAALARVLGTARAVEVMEEVMDVTAREALLLCLPDAEEVARFPDPFAAMRAYMQAAPDAAARAGCHAATVTTEGDRAFRMDVTWCVWLELARRMGVPDGCRPNCYADDLVFPAYFRRLGILYGRTGTLAGEAPRCDFRFERDGDG